jgi:hypothetical protein
VWWPRSVAELKAAFEAGDLIESHSLELKRELPAPGKSIDVAIDVCAMTPEGGVIIYGVSDLDAAAGDLVPFDLAGQRDRIFQIVAAGIAEVPRIDVLELSESENGDGRRGFLAVVVPASSRAPHMVTVKGERRYYGRNGTQNVRLGEGEVARLYERRSQRAVDTDALLDAHIERSSVPASLDHGRLYLVVAPALGDDELLERARAATAVPGMERFPAILSEHFRRARTVAPSRGFAPTTDHLAGWTPTSRGFCVSSALDGGPDLSSTDPDSALKVEVSYGGEVTIDCGRAAFGDRSGGRLYIFEQLIAGLTTQGPHRERSTDPSHTTATSIGESFTSRPSGLLETHMVPPGSL